MSNTAIAAIKEPPIIKDPQLFSYLQEMARQINYALAQNEVEIKKVIRRTVTDMQQDPSTEFFKQKAAEAQKLRGLIEQTATLIEAVEDIEETLKTSKYVAYSEFGEVYDQWVRKTRDSASGTEIMYTYQEDIKASKAADSALREWQLKTTQFIKTGNILTGEYGQPIVGIAIGHANTEIDVEDMEGEYEMSIGEYSATFTANELAFWNGDPDNAAKMAWINNKALYISNGQINNELRIGKWLFKPDAGNGDLTISYQAG